MFNFTIHTMIEINTPAEPVWNALTDLGKYHEWNPMIREAAGELKPGARLRLHFHPDNARGWIFKPKLMVVNPNRELRWKGQPGVPLIFESEHYFIIEPVGKERVRLIHNMEFYGLAIPFAKKRTIRMLQGPFVLMNQALKERAEKRH